MRDLSVHKKLLLSHWMVILIPVMAVLILTGAALTVFLSVMGSGLRAALLEVTGDTVSNYQLELAFDSMSREISANPGWKEHPDFTGLSDALEKRGALVWVYSGEETLYLSEGGSPDEVRRIAERLGAKLTSPIFLRGDQGMVFHTTIEPPERETVSMTVVAPSLVLQGDEQNVLDFIKASMKVGAVVVVVVAVGVIAVTGILLSHKVSASILQPIRTLQEAASRICDGNLEDPVLVQSHDELGELCEDFEQMRLRLKESVEAQQALQEQRGEMIAGISHDLSTPLTAIKGYVSGLLDGVADTPEKRSHYLKTIYDTACGMEHMVDSLFLFTKLDLGRVPFDLQTVEAGRFLQDFVDETALRLKRDHMRIRLVNQAPPHLTVRIDLLQMGRVLQNLTENSVRYRRPGVAQGNITVTLSETVSGACCICFADDGMGVDSSEMEKIFGTFYRTDPARTNVSKGSGLGLSIARQILEHMGGEIHAQPSDEGGLCVTMTLPGAENRALEKDGRDEKNTDH